MDEELKANLSRRETWLRLLFMLLFTAIYSLAEVVLGAVVVFQFASTLITGRRNQRLLALGQSLSAFVYEILRYLTYNTDDRPYPFGPWPQGAGTGGPARPLGNTPQDPGADSKEAGS